MITHSIWKGHKVVTIENDGYKFTLGLGKVSAILACADDIKNSQEYKDFMTSREAGRAEREAKAQEREVKKQQELKVYLNSLPKEMIKELLKA